MQKELLEKFKEFEGDYETRMFTRQLIYLFLAQLGYEKLLTNREKTTSALESINPNPLFNLLTSKIHVQRKQKQSSPEILTGKSEDRREPDDSDTIKQSES